MAARFDRLSRLAKTWNEYARQWLRGFVATIQHDMTT
jgi:hypothetical protein